MSKIFILPVLLLAACTAAPQTDSVHLPSKNISAAAPKASVAKNNIRQKRPAKKTANFIYAPEVKKYIDQNQGVKTLKNIAPEYALKKFTPLCTVEKFIAGLNSSETDIVKTPSAGLIIKTKGAKIGSGTITVAIKGRYAKITSAVVGSIRQTNADVLDNLAPNICQSTEEKAKTK